MIALRANKKFLDLGNAAATVTFENPIFDEERTARTFSYPFKIPASIRNRELQGNRHRIDSRKNATQEDGQLYLSDQLIDVGTITTKSRSNSGTSIYFQNDQIRFWESITNLNINEILDTITVPDVSGAAEWRFHVEFVVSTQYEISIRKRLFSYVSGSNDNGGDVADRLAFLINAEFPGLASSINATGDLIILAPEVDPVLIDFDQLSSNLTLTNENSRGQKRHKDFLSLINDITNIGDDRLCFPTIRNEGFYPPGRNYKYSNQVNAFSSDKHLSNDLELGEHWFHTFTPCVKLKYIMETILSHTKYTAFRGPIIELPEYSELCLYSNYALDQLFFDNYQEGPRWINHHKQEINLNEHVPEMSARDFLTAFMEIFNLHIDIKGDYIYFRSRSEPIRQAPIDWTHLATPAYNIEESARKGFRLKFPKDPTDRYSPQLPAYISGQGGRYLTTTFGSFPMLSLVSDFSYRLLPVAKQLGRTDAMDTSGEIPTPRLLFYKGLKLSGTGIPYPLATSSTVDYLGNSIGSQALVWEGSEGLYEQHHKGIVDLLDKDTATIDITLTAGDLLLLTRWRNARRKIYHPLGTLDAIIKTVKIRAFANTRKLVATVELVTTI